MAKGYNPTQYMYSSARIRALEIKIATRERLRQLSDATNAESVIAGLSDLGFETAKNGVALSREEMLESLLVNAYAEVESMECADAVKFMRYQYDANNIKAILKCHWRGVSADSLLSSFGTVSAAEAKKAFESKDYSAFSENIAKAIGEAEEAFAATNDPQKIDFIIDRACFADMLESVDALGMDFSKRLVRTKIDIVNITVSLRIMRMELGNMALGVLNQAYIEGGSFGLEFFESALSAGEEEFAASIAARGYSTIADAIAKNETLGTIERKADDAWFSVAKEAKYISFGAEIAVGYIAALEYQVKNIRIILAGKDAWIAPELIRERLRDCYA